MVGQGSRAKALRIAVLAIYGMFSLFGSSIHAWSHHGSGDACHGGCSAAEMPVGGCDEMSSHSHGHSCQHPTSTSSCEFRKPRSCGPVISESRVGRSRVSHASNHATKPCDRSSTVNVATQADAKSGSHSCRICHEIASLMNSWSASISAWSFDLQQTDRLIDSCGSDTAVDILMARSRGPPSRI